MVTKSHGPASRVRGLGVGVASDGLSRDCMGHIGPLRGGMQGGLLLRNLNSATSIQDLEFRVVYEWSGQGKPT